MTQRKFLRQIIQFNERITTNKPYPRLLIVDLIEQSKMNNLRQKNKPDDENVNKNLIEDDSKDFCICLKPICEYQEGWHQATSLVPLLELSPIQISYLSMIMKILKNGNLQNELKIFTTENGNKILNEIELKAKTIQFELSESYNSIRNHFVNEIENGNVLSLEESDLNKNNNNEDGLENSLYKTIGLSRCELKSGKIAWLCKNHVQQTEAKTISELISQTGLLSSEQARNQMILDLETVNLQII